MRQGLYVAREESAWSLLRDWAMSGCEFVMLKTGIGAAPGTLRCVAPSEGKWADLYARDDLKAIKGWWCFASDVGPSGTHFISDGTYLRPRDGRATIQMRIGSQGAHLDLRQVSGAAQFVLPAPVSFPAGLIAPNSKVHCFADLRRTGTNATATIAVRLGTAGNATDSFVYEDTIAAANNNYAQIDQAARFGTLTNSFLTLNKMAKNANGASANSGDKTTQVNTLAAMSMTIDLAGANSGDAFYLLAYGSVLESF